MRWRLERRIEAYVDDALSSRQRARLERRLSRDPQAARLLESKRGLGRVVRAAWALEAAAEPAPPAEALIAAVRPALARIDAEISTERSRRTFADALRELATGRPLPSLAAAAVALVILGFVALPLVPWGPDARSPVAKAVEHGTVYDLEQGQHPLMVLEGEDGATIIWILEDDDAEAHRFPGLRLRGRA
jgi:hypothetical protein